MRTEQHHQQGVFEERAFSRLPAAVGVARDWVTTAVKRAGATEEQAATCALLVSELATNAVLHAEGDTFAVAVWPGGIVDVRDRSTRGPVPRHSGPEDENGRGLQLVQVLSRKFEVIPVDGGKISRFWL